MDTRCVGSGLFALPSVKILSIKRTLALRQMAFENQLQGASRDDLHFVQERLTFLGFAVENWDTIGIIPLSTLLRGLQSKCTNNRILVIHRQTHMMFLCKAL